MGKDPKRTDEGCAVWKLHSVLYILKHGQSLSIPLSVGEVSVAMAMWHLSILCHVGRIVAAYLSLKRFHAFVGQLGLIFATYENKLLLGEIFQRYNKVLKNSY